MTSLRKHIVVIGAGVIGLQTALSLLEAGYEVTVVAKHYPGETAPEYTSPWAGAHWRTHAPVSDEEQKAWDIETYKHWVELVRKEEQEQQADDVRSGLGICRSDYYTASPLPPWFAPSVLSFQEIPSRTLYGQSLRGDAYQSIMINAPKYIQYLNNKVVFLGASTIRAALPTPSTIAETVRHVTDIVHSNDAHSTPISAFINATGISAKTLVPDEDVYPVSGQTVTVKGEAHRITTVDAPPEHPTPDSPSITYILPRPQSGTTVLGGTRVANDSSRVPNPNTTKEILERAKEFAPELLNSNGEFEVESVQVGWRPARKGGARVELEVVEGMVVVHEYGHAGAGYQNSVGSARKVLQLLSEYFG